MYESCEVTVPTENFLSQETGNNTVAAASEYSGLTITHGEQGHVGWKVNLRRGGKWYLCAHMTALVSRPCTLSINGEAQRAPILSETTGSWTAEGLKWFSYGPYMFKDGDNVIRIDFKTYMPHLKELGFAPVHEQLLEAAADLSSDGSVLPGSFGSL